jgi:7tm Chemosensory receptor
LAFAVFISILRCIICVENSKKFFVNLSEVIANILKHFGLGEDFRFLKKSTWRRFLFMLIVIIAIELGLLVYYVESTNEFIFIAATIPSVFYLFMLVYMFNFFVGLVNAQLSLLSSAVQNIFNHHHEPAVEVINNRWRCGKPRGVKDPLSRLQAAIRVYSLLYDCGSLINHNFGLILLILIVVVVIILMSLFYQLFMIVVGAAPMYVLLGKSLLQTLN